jgi:hypothetical protein
MLRFVAVPKSLYKNSIGALYHANLHCNSHKLSANILHTVQFQYILQHIAQNAQ